MLGVILMLLLVTGGFGLFSKGAAATTGDEAMLRKGDRIIVPEHSPLRDRLAVAPAQAQGTAEKLVLPGIVESNPAATAVVLSPVAGRVLEIKVECGIDVEAGAREIAELARLHHLFELVAHEVDEVWREILGCGLRLKEI